jgi:hypothetical protein
MSSASNTGHPKSYDFDFSKSFAVQWGETQISECLRLDAYEIQDQRIADWLNQKLPPLYADAIDIAAAAHCADRLSLRGTKKHGWGRDLRLKIPVRCLAVWQTAAVRDALFEVLQFLTQDKWQIDFDQKDGNFRQSENATATDVRNQLIHLYEQHVREWNAFSALKHLQQQSPTSVSTCVV